MPNLSLSYEDAAVLHEILEASLADLRRELWHTDSREFRDLLRQRVNTIERMIANVSATAIAS